MTQLCATQLVLLNNYFLLLCTANTHRKAAIQTTIWITFRALSQVQVYWNWNTQRFYANHPSTSWLLTRPTSIHTYIYILFFFNLWPNSPKWAQVATMLKFLDHTHTHTYSVGLLCTSDQPVAEAATYTTNTRDEHPCPQRGSNPRYQQSSGLRPTP